MSAVGRAIREWWHVAAGVVLGILAIGNLYWDVQQLKNADQTALMQRLEAVERRTGDDAFADWHQWRAQAETRLDRVEGDLGRAQESLNTLWRRTQ